MGLLVVLRFRLLRDACYTIDKGAGSAFRLKRSLNDGLLKATGDRTGIF